MNKLIKQGILMALTVGVIAGSILWMSTHPISIFVITFIAVIVFMGL